MHRQAAHCKGLACKPWTTQKTFLAQTHYSFSWLAQLDLAQNVPLLSCEPKSS